MKGKFIFKNILTLVFLFVSNFCVSQEIFGIVLNSKTDQPLVGTSIYFDNTTFGTTSNSKGEFVLEFHKDIKTPLVISFMGFETKILYKFSTIEKLKIYLDESLNNLDEVLLISKDDWSRALKLSEFKKHYLGESQNSLACEILNENDIILNYDKKKKLLTAKAKNSILIQNNNLKYLITGELQNFEVGYSYVGKHKKQLIDRYVYYSGRNFYKSMEFFPEKNTIEKRVDVFFGSKLHFMRALANEDLEDEGYDIFIGNVPVKSKRHIIVIPIDSLGIVKVKLKDKLNIWYNKKQSSLECSAPAFYIDPYGNYFPPGKVRFSGKLGSYRMGDALPLDFMFTKN